MIDFHSHILPGIDDGSKDTATSIRMIEEEMRQGVTGIALTPHFYADTDDPQQFLARRERAFRELQETLEEEEIKVPRMILGSEVHFYRGMSRSESLRKLCLGESNYILVELPFRRWQQYIVDDVKDIGNNLGLNVIIAHFERYLDQDRKLVKQITEDEDLIIQSNAEFSLEKDRRKALRYLKDGTIDILGSDCHNTDSRRPNLKDAMDLIGKKLGDGYVTGLEEKSRALFARFEVKR